MKTQHPNEHQFLKDISNIFSQRISGNFMNTKDRHHIELFKREMFKCLYACANSNHSLIGIFRIRICKPSLATIPKIMNYWFMWYTFSCILTSIFLIKLF